MDCTLLIVADHGTVAGSMFCQEHLEIKEQKCLERQSVHMSSDGSSIQIRKNVAEKKKFLLDRLENKKRIQRL